MSGRKQILVAVTNQRMITATYRSGLWFEEFAVPYRAFTAAGYEVTVASPLGGVGPVDPRSMPRPEDVPAWLDVIELLVETHVLAEFDSADFDAIFLPGGHGAMFDLPHCVALHQLLREFARADKVIATVCHGAAGLIGAEGARGGPLVEGRRITAFTDEEERATKLDQVMPFLLERELRARGAAFVAQPSWSDHVERDGMLITGQNPQSSASIAQAMIAALEPQLS
jgi:putative intracellular protease/amidase